MNLGSEARFPLGAEWTRIQDSVLDAGELFPQPDLVAFPLRSDWEATLPKQVSAYPAPERSSRAGDAGPMPTALEKAAQFARKAAWGVIPQGSRGNVPHGSTGRPTALKDLFALRFGGHLLTERRAYVVYETPAGKAAWKPRSVMIWGPDFPPYAHCSVTDLRTYLAEMALGGAGQIKLWIKGLEKARVESEAVQKRRATVRRLIVKAADEGRFKAGQAESRTAYRELEDAWMARVAELQEDVFTSDEVAAMIDPDRRRRASREGMS